MQSDALTDTRTHVERLLSSDNNVIRSATIRALPSLVDDPDHLRAMLVDLLMDEDPDIRCDAMEALGPVAAPGDAQTIRQSLEGDPVREVKLAAITALARLQDTGSVPLLRALATSRSDDRIAWEDETGDWEEWLDIQTAAIDALGQIGATDAIGDMIDALFDVYGQNVDDHVFAAFGRMGDHGASVLLEAFRQTKGITRRRAAAALGQVSSGSLTDHVEDLLREDDPAIRLLALKCLSSDDARCADLARSDPDPGMRAAALAKTASHQPELVRQALSDSDQGVKAIALDCLAPPFNPDYHQTLIDNMLVWLGTAKPALGEAILRKMSQIAPNRALGPIVQILDDRDRDLELRVSVAKMLGYKGLEAPLDLIAEQMQNPARQVRTAILTVLRNRTETEPKAARLAAAAIAGTLELDPQILEDPAPESTVDAGTPKEGSGPRNIWITPDGDIVERPESTGPVSGTSTLDGILEGANAPEPPLMAGDTPEESGAKRAKRRPVEGTSDISQTLACDTLSVFMQVDNEDIRQAILSRLGDGDDTLRRAAWRGMAGRPADEAALEAAKTAMQDPDPIIRMAAFQLRLAGDDLSALAAALEDDDALIRAEAVTRLPPEAALDFLADAAPPVRKAAGERIAETRDAARMLEAIRKAMAANFSDVIRRMLTLNPDAEVVRTVLTTPETNARETLVFLRGLAA